MGWWCWRPATSVIQARRRNWPHTRRYCCATWGSDGRESEPVGGQLHRLDDVDVARAATEVPGDRLADFLLGWIRRFFQEGGDRHEEPGGAEPTLQPVRVPERFLNRVQSFSVAQPLDGHQGVPVGLHPQQQAGAHRLTVQKNGAGPADAVLAPQVGAGQPEVFAEHVGQRAAHGDRDGVALAVHVERDGLLGDRLQRRDLSRADSPHRYIPPASVAGPSARPAGRCHEAPFARDAAVCSARRASAPPTCRRESAEAWMSLSGCSLSLTSRHISASTPSSNLRPPANDSASGIRTGVGPTPVKTSRTSRQRCSASRRRTAATPTRAKSPCRRLTSANAHPPSRHSGGKRTSVNISVGSSAVARYETKNCCGESTRGVVVPRPWRATMKLASSAAATAGSSAAGSAWARLPPMVPRFRICGCPTHCRASASSGTWAATTGDRSAVRWRVSAPMRIVPFSSLM